MRVLVVLLAVVGLGQTDLLQEWQWWKEINQKVYSTEDEVVSRKEIWMRNARKISEHNSRNETFVMQLNKFADLVSRPSVL